MLACTDAVAPTVPREVTQAAGPVTAVSAGSSAIAVEDALDRLIPALDDEDAARGLRVALTALADALSRSDDGQADAALEQAERLLDGYAQGARADADAADLDAIALAIASARRQG